MWAASPEVDAPSSGAKGLAWLQDRLFLDFCLSSFALVSVNSGPNRNNNKARSILLSNMVTLTENAGKPPRITDWSFANGCIRDHSGTSFPSMPCPQSELVTCHASRSHAKLLLPKCWVCKHCGWFRFHLPLRITCPAKMSRCPVIPSMGWKNTDVYTGIPSMSRKLQNSEKDNLLCKNHKIIGLCACCLTHQNGRKHHQRRAH